VVGLSTGWTIPANGCEFAPAIGLDPLDCRPAHRRCVQTIEGARPPDLSLRPFGRRAVRASLCDVRSRRTDRPGRCRKCGLVHDAGSGGPISLWTGGHTLRRGGAAQIPGTSDDRIAGRGRYARDKEPSPVKARDAAGTVSIGARESVFRRRPAFGSDFRSAVRLAIGNGTGRRAFQPRDGTCGGGASVSLSRKCIVDDPPTGHGQHRCNARDIVFRHC